MQIIGLFRDFLNDAHGLIWRLIIAFLISIIALLAGAVFGHNLMEFTTDVLNIAYDSGAVGRSATEGLERNLMAKIWGTWVGMILYMGWVFIAGQFSNKYFCGSPIPDFKRYLENIIIKTIPFSGAIIIGIVIVVGQMGWSVENQTIVLGTIQVIPSVMFLQTTFKEILAGEGIDPYGWFT